MTSPDADLSPIEPDAMRGRWLVISIAALFATLVGAFVAMRLFLALASRPRDVDAPRSVVAGLRPENPTPPLQPSIGHDTKPADDLVIMKRNENAVFERLGWSIDPTTNEPRVPDAILSKLATTRPEVSR